MNIICLSTQNWDDSFWTNKQHIMSRLSQEHKIIYVDRGVLGLRYFFFKKITASKIIFSLKFFFRLFEERSKNLTILTEKVNFPFSFAFKIWLLKRYTKKHKIMDPILWIYQPEYEKYIGQFGEKLVIYDCVDEYSAFPSYKDKKKEIVETEKNLMRKADLVITSSEHLYKTKKPFNSKTYLVHNVADYDHFIQVFNKKLLIPKDIANVSKPILGFIGAIDHYKLNLTLLDYIAENRPNYSIILIGSVGKIDSATRISFLKKRKNVFFLGEKPYNLLPNYIKAFDICMIPYNINDYTKNCFPIKFFEFMATGKPVITTSLPALAEYKGFIEYAETNDAFVLEIDKLLKNDSEEQKIKRIRIAKDNSWQVRIDMIMNLIKKRLDEKIVSVELPA